MTPQAATAEALRNLARAGNSLGLAVSGGSDSMAMLHLMVAQGWQGAVVTVDHGLRAEARAEAAFVGRVCAGLGCRHDVLVWQHGRVAGNLMQAARQARYQLIEDWARQAGLDAVALAHTADDQAETLLMGLARAAGLDGLCGMRAEFGQGPRFLRPYLQVTRADLRQGLVDGGLEWVDDPTNDNADYTRVAMRQALAQLAPLGLTATALAQSARNLGQARGALDAAVAATAQGLVAQGLVAEVAGALRLDPKALNQLHPGQARRLVALAHRWIAGGAHGPRGSDMDRFAQAALAGKSATLAGVRIIIRSGQVWLLREARAVGGMVGGMAGGLWDGRWHIAAPEGAEVRALGAAGLAALGQDWRAIAPREVFEVTPSIWDASGLVHTPLMEKSAAFDRMVQPSFADFILSH